MSSIGTGYDLSASQFSPDGRIFQVEYAGKAVENSSTALGLRGKDGVVLAVEKLITSKLFEPDCNKKIFHIDEHIGMTATGLLADVRAMAERGREDSMDYRDSWKMPISLSNLNNRLAGYAHAYTLYSALRPFGAAVILASWTDTDGADMYMIQPSGVSYGYYGIAVGKAAQAAKTEIEKLNLKDMGMKELAKEAARIIYSVHDEVKDKTFQLEMSWVGKDTGGRHEWLPDNVKEEVENEAKRALEESDDED